VTQNLPTSHSGPLNPTLFSLLRDRFRSVQVANEGQEMVWTTVPSMTRPGKTQMFIISAGEYYRIACPYCSDQRHRLWVNHRYGTRGTDGRPMLWLAHCYNENCLDSPARRQHLERMIFGFRNERDRNRVVVIIPGDTRLAALSPGLVELPDHPVKRDLLADPRCAEGHGPRIASWGWSGQRGSRAGDSAGELSRIPGTAAGLDRGDKGRLQSLREAVANQASWLDLEGPAAARGHRARTRPCPARACC
jgi:hypothetical protein